jgi:archaellum component FlaC
MLFSNLNMTMQQVGDWNSHLIVDNDNIDAISGYILRGLQEESPRTSGELREYLNAQAERKDADSLVVDQSRQIIYRCEKHLNPNELVKELPREPDPDGGGHPARRFKISGLGYNWCTRQDWGVNTYREEIDDIYDRVVDVEDDLSHQIEDLEDKVETAIATAQSASGEVGGLRSTVESYKQRYNSTEDDYNSMRESLNELDSRVDGIDDRVENMGDEIEVLQSDACSFDNRLSSLKESRSKLVGETEQLCNCVNRLDNRIDDVEGQVEKAIDTAAQPPAEIAEQYRQIQRLRLVSFAQLIALVVILVWTVVGT